MLILSHLLAALASVLPILLAIQKGRNGDFDYIYQRTIDYTSSFQVPDVFRFLLPTSNQDVVIPVVPLVNVTNVTISQSVTSQIDTQLDENPAYLNVTGEPSYAAPYPRSVFPNYRQAAFSVVDTWLCLSKYILLIFDGFIRMMEDLKDFSAELHLHHYDFSHSSTPRTRKALLVAYISMLRSLVRKVLPLSLAVAMLVKLSAVVLCMLSIGLGYHVYTLFQTLAKEKEDLKQEENAFVELVAHAETLRKDLDQQVMLLDDKEENLRLHETEEKAFMELVAQAETLRKDLDQQVMLLDKKEENLRLHETEESQLQAQTDTLQNDLDQRTKLLIESQKDLKFQGTAATQLRAHAASLQRDLDQQTKLFADGQEELRQHERTAAQLRAQAGSLQEDLDARTKQLAEGQECVEQQVTAAKVLQAHADTLQHDLEQQKQLLEDQRQMIEEFQTSSNQQLGDSQAKIVSLEEAMQAQLQRHGEAQAKLLKQAQEEAQCLQAGKEALDTALMAERQQSYRALDRAKVTETKHTDTTRRLNAVNIMYENQKQTLKQKTAQIEELTSERDELAQAAKRAEATGPELRNRLQKLETDFANKVSALTSLEQQLQETQAHLDQRAAALEVTHTQNDELSQKLLEAGSRSQSLEDEVKRLEDDVSRKSSAVEASEQQAEQLHKTSDENALVMASLRAELAALRHEHTEARVKEESIRKRTEGLKTELETKTSVIETLEAQAEQERRSACQKTADLTTAESRVSALRQDNEMARARAEKLQERANRLEHELAVNTSSIEASERKSEHQEQVSQQRNAELAQALELVKDLEGQLDTLRTEVEARGHGSTSEAEQPARAERDDSLGVKAKAEAQELAHEADPAHHAPPAAQEGQETVEGAEDQQETPARKGGHRRKRRRAGKRQAAKRQPIPRRHSFDLHAHKSCSRCGGPLPVKVNCVPNELRQAIWTKPAETGMPVRSRRNSLDSPAHRPCPECGGVVPVEVALAMRERLWEIGLDVPDNQDAGRDIGVSEARGMQDDDRAGASSTGELTRPEGSQSSEATVSAPTEHTVASQTVPTSSHVLEHDGASEADGAEDQAEGRSVTLLVLAQNADAGVEAKGARQMMSKSKLGNYSVLNESLQRLIMSRSLRPRQCSPAAGVLREARRRSLTSRLLGLPHSPAAGFLREACLLTKSPALGPTSPRSSLRYLHPLLRAPSRRTDHQGRTPASGTTSVSSITPSGPAIRASLPRASRPPTMPAPHGLLGNAHLFSTRLLIPSFHKARSSPKTPTGGNLPFSLASTSIPAPWISGQRSPSRPPLRTTGQDKAQTKARLVPSHGSNVSKWVD